MFAHRSALQDVYINSISFSSNGRNVVCSRDNGVIDLVNVECARCVSLPLAGGCLILSPSGVAHWDAVLCDLTALTADTVLIFHAHFPCPWAHSCIRLENRFKSEKGATHVASTHHDLSVLVGTKDDGKGTVAYVSMHDSTIMRRFEFHNDRYGGIG